MVWRQLETHLPPSMIKDATRNKGHRYEGSDRTLRTGLLALLLGAIGRYSEHSSSSLPISSSLSASEKATVTSQAAHKSAWTPHAEYKAPATLLLVLKAALPMAFNLIAASNLEAILSRDSWWNFLDGMKVCRQNMSYRLSSLRAIRALGLCVFGKKVGLLQRCNCWPFDFHPKTDLAALFHYSFLRSNR